MSHGALWCGVGVGVGVVWVWVWCGCGCGVGVVRCAMRDSRCWRGSRSAPRRVAPPMQYVVAVYDIHVVVNHLYFIYHDGYGGGGGRGNGHGNGSDRIGVDPCKKKVCHKCSAATFGIIHLNE